MITAAIKGWLRKLLPTMPPADPAFIEKYARRRAEAEQRGTAIRERISETRAAYERERSDPKK